MDTKKKIAITTDTNSGMLPGEGESEGIFVLPMPFIIDNDCLLESVDLSREVFYEKLISKAKISTSQPSLGDLSEFWTKILKDYDEIVHIPTASTLSASYASAKSLAEDFNGKVHVVDNHRISIVLKSSVYDAKNLRDNGDTAQEICNKLEETQYDHATYFSLESMEYLKRGGRVSAAAAAIGSILRLRPVLCIHQGKLVKYALPKSLTKAKMTMLDAIKKDLSEKFKEYADKGEMRICLVYGDNKEEVASFEQEVRKEFPNVPILYNDPMSLSIACHTGPKTFALACTRVLK